MAIRVRERRFIRSMSPWNLRQPNMLNWHHLIASSDLLQIFLLHSNRNASTLLLLLGKRSRQMGDKPDVWQGTLALMILKTLQTMGPQHGYGLARRIEQT